MNEEEIKKLVAEINLKLEGVKEGQLTDEAVETAIQKAITDQNIEGKALKEFAEELQKQTNTLEAEVKTLKARTLQDDVLTLQAAILKGLEGVKEVALEHMNSKAGFQFDLDEKTDLTSATNLVNSGSNWET